MDERKRYAERLTEAYKKKRNENVFCIGYQNITKRKEQPELTKGAANMEKII